MKKLILLAMMLLLVAGCAQFSGFIKSNRYTPPEPEPNQRISSGVNMNFFPGEPPSNEIKGQFLLTLEARNFMREQQTLDVRLWQSNKDLVLVRGELPPALSIPIDGAQYDEDTGKFIKDTVYRETFGPLEFSGATPASETTFNAVATYSVVSEGLVMQFCAEDRKVQKDPEDSCTYSSMRTGDGFTRNPITIEGFRHVLSGDGRGRVLVTMEFDVVNKGPGVAIGEGLYEEVKFDISSPSGGMAFDCTKNDASEETSAQRGLPLTLYLGNGKAGVTCTSEISLADLYKKEDYSLEFHMDYVYKVLAKVVGVKVKADSTNSGMIQ